MVTEISHRGDSRVCRGILGIHGTASVSRRYGFVAEDALTHCAQMLDVRHTPSFSNIEGNFRLKVGRGILGNSWDGLGFQKVVRALLQWSQQCGKTKPYIVSISVLEIGQLIPRIG